ncbi:zinc-dependent alcohol dehydrogenase family protein [Halioxenophilus aromaticivorans]|uniref:NAD(P)-dependent alcohol dehydrogenase n=1 Tax=Halioxenophilus aromaticivorans TaxID=1306992 RepID=A0AAV3U454_9ALTE
MRAMRLRQPASLKNLYLDSIEISTPGPDEIQVRIKGASVNFRDGLVVNGFFPVDNGLIPLSDGAGEIIAAGKNVKEFVIGDRVVSTFHPNWLTGHIERTQLNNSPGGPADGFACDIVTRPAHHFTHAPQHLSFTESATLTCAGVTAWRAVAVDADVKPGNTVLILGTGGVSLFALQFAKAAGAKVIATTSNEKKMEKLEHMGADHVVNYTKTGNWADAVLSLTNGIGVDVVVEVGGPNTMAQSLKACRTGAHVAIIGAAAGFDIDTIPFAVIQSKRLRLQGVTVGSRADQITMVKAMELDRIKPYIGATFPLESLPDAFITLNNNGHFGKIAIEV